MKKLIAVFVLGCLPSFALASSPTEVLETYFEALQQNDLTGMHDMMATEDLNKMKEMLDRVVREQAEKGNNRLQFRLFGRKLSSSELSKVTTEQYVMAVSEEILKAATSMHFAVVDRTILGHIPEGEDKLHYLARVHMQQDEKTNSEVTLYTVVKEGDGWKLSFPPTFRQLLTMIEASGR